MEIVRRVSDAFRAAAWDGALGAYDDEAELDMTRMPGGGVHHGPDAVRDFFTLDRGVGPLRGGAT